MNDIFIVDGVRTPIGGAGRSLKEVSAIDLGARVIRTLLDRHPAAGELVDEVIMGNVVSAGLGQNPARQASLKAGLPAQTPAFTVNKVCGSGLKAVILASQALQCGDADFILAGGLESASRCPYIVDRNKKSSAREAAKDSLVHDGLWCHLSDMHMGLIAESTAEEFKVSRDEQDRYALESHRKALVAQEKGLFGPEIVPVEVGGRLILRHDEKPRKALSLERLAALPAAFKTGGTVTAGNASTPADAAAVLMMASEKAFKENKMTPGARILGYTTVAVEPKQVFTAPARAVHKCLEISRLAMSDVDLFEINEAFAVQALLTARQVGLRPERMNIFGGTLALGHPLGASGVRGLLTLMNALRSRDKKIGVTAVCLGGGCAVSLAIRML